MRSPIAVAVTLTLVAGTAFAAPQYVRTKKLLVVNPPSGTRAVMLLQKESPSTATLVGNPTVDGATLRIELSTGGDQCVTMPASRWTALNTVGFKYGDSGLVNGPVKSALIKKTPSGTFLLKVLLKTGSPTPITVIPGNPTLRYATNFTLGQVEMTTAAAPRA